MASATTDTNGDRSGIQATSPWAIQFDNVSGGYKHHQVFSNLSFAIEQGSMTAIIGPNGSGKTTLLRAVTGLLDRVTGDVRVFGRSINSMSPPERAALVGVIPQETHTPMAYSVEEIVMMGRTHALSRWHMPPPEEQRIVEQAMVYTDVISMRHRPFPELSGGERQRAVIAMVLAQQPRIILMDEATSHLDINHRLEIMQLIERLNKEEGVTVLMVSHDLNMAAEFCDRLLMVDEGRLVADGESADVLTRETIRSVYHCDVTIQQNPQSGSVMVVPSPRLSDGLIGKGITVHIIAGGGCGGEVLRRLNLCGYTVTCGVLNKGDSDADAAAALELETSLEKPFSHVEEEALASANKLAETASAIIVCRVPFGPGNVANLDLAIRAIDRGTAVLLAEGIESRDYTPNHQASRLAAELRQKGAKEWQSIADLLQLLSGQ